MPGGDVLAGAAVADITPGVGIPMGGYGARVGVSQGINDALHVRTLVLSDGEAELSISVCDLIGVSPGLVSAARRLIAEEAGIPAERVLIAATHTHSGPAGVRGADANDYVNTTARAIAGSVLMAKRALTPVSLKLGEVEVTTISQNRRDPQGPIERTARVLLAAPPAPAAPVATLVNYACHSTVFEHDNLDYSADFPGAMARAVEREVGGTAIYLQGAAGNINPVWMRHDPTEVERVGGILGAAATRVAHELRPLGEGQWCINLNWSEDVPLDAAGSVIDGVAFAGASRTIELERRPRGNPDELAAELDEVAAQIKAATDTAERRRLTARRNELSIDRLFATFATKPTQLIEIQALRLSRDCAVIALPGEFFVEIADDLRRRAGIRHLLVAGYANGMMGYVPTAEAFAHGGYEVGSAQFAPDTAETITKAALELLGQLG